MSTVTFAASSSLCGSRFFADSSLRAIELRLRVGELHLGPLEIALRLAQVGLRLRQVGARLLDLGLEQRRVEPGEDLALPDERVEVGVQLRDVARHLGADLDRRDRLQRAGRADRVDDVAAGDRGGGHRDFGAAFLRR